MEMNVNYINTENWISFKLSQIFSSIENGKVSDTSILDDGNEIYYIGAKKENNGIIKKCKYNKDLISKGNCVIFICDGQGSIGYNNYMPDDFIGTVNLSLGYSENLNQYTGLFLVTILDKERFRFSFGRKRKLTLRETTIKLPASSSGDPDWQFMEDYIKSLNVNLPITNNNKSSVLDNKYKLDIEKWRCFELGKLFNIETGTDLIYQEQEVGKYPVVGHNETNNGITCYIKELADRKLYDHNKTISLGDRGCFIAYVQPHDFYIGTRVKALISNSKLANIWNLQFISTIINQEKFKYNYGRNATDKIPKIEIKLPITSNGDPDWQFMEEYIKSLPYGDCL